MTAPRIGEGASLIVLCARHIKGAAVLFGDHRGLTNVVWVHVGTNDPDDWFATQFVLEDLVPEFCRLGVADARIDNVPTSFVF